MSLFEALGAAIFGSGGANLLGIEKYFEREFGMPVVKAAPFLRFERSPEMEPFVSELNPSAENLAKYFYDQTTAQLREMTAGRVRVKDCTLYETDTSFARYYE